MDFFDAMILIIVFESLIKIKIIIIIIAVESLIKIIIIIIIVVEGLCFD